MTSTKDAGSRAPAGVEWVAGGAVGCSGGLAGTKAGVAFSGPTELCEPETDTLEPIRCRCRRLGGGSLPHWLSLELPALLPPPGVALVLLPWTLVKLDESVLGRFDESCGSGECGPYFALKAARYRQ